MDATPPYDARGLPEELLALAPSLNAQAPKRWRVESVPRLWLECRPHHAPGNLAHHAHGRLRIQLGRPAPPSAPGFPWESAVYADIIDHLGTVVSADAEPLSREHMTLNFLRRQRVVGLDVGRGPSRR